MDIQPSAQIFSQISGDPLSLVFQIERVRIVIFFPVKGRTGHKLSVNAMHPSLPPLLGKLLKVRLLKFLPGFVSGNIAREACGKIFGISRIFIQDLPSRFLAEGLAAAFIYPQHVQLFQILKHPYQRFSLGKGRPVNLHETFQLRLHVIDQLRQQKLLLFLPVLQKHEDHAQDAVIPDLRKFLNPHKAFRVGGNLFQLNQILRVDQLPSHLFSDEFLKIRHIPSDPVIFFLIRIPADPEFFQQCSQLIHLY